MFNNLFDSFQDSIAEAKDEREQLDRLLTISTPRERLIVAATAVILLIVVSWLFLGNTVRSLTADGVLVVPVENLSEESQSIQALIWIKSNAAADIQAGLRTVIELDMADGEIATMDGEIVTISAVPLSERLAMMESVVPVSVYRVDIALEETPDFASLADKNCRVIIQLGTQSPISLFGMRLL